jgi:NAD(P)H-dependent FMN reductase
MSGTPFRLAVIVGSVRSGRFGPTVARWFTGQAGKRADLLVDVVDLGEVAVSMALSDSGGEVPEESERALRDLAERLGAADAFVVITPEYNHSFPASLKSAIDRHYTEWQAKPVGFVSYGGWSGGLRAVEQLRLVFAELHAVTIRDTVSFHGARSVFDAEGDPVSPEGCNEAAKVLLDQLSWWAGTLREARAVRPYAA